MPAAQLHLIAPPPVAEYVERGRLNDALRKIAELAGAELTVSTEPAAQAAGNGEGTEVPIQYRGRTLGRLICQPNGQPSEVVRAASVLAELLEHLVDREYAVGDLADAMFTSYEELNLFYALLPNIAAKVDRHEIGEGLVDETARILNCRRVSLMVLDEAQENLTVLAARGLPPECLGISIPVTDSVAALAVTDESVTVVNDIGRRPELLEKSRGDYETSSFVVVRVPLRARGQSLGILTATDRRDSPEFTARDRKLLEGLSSIGASALLNCRLHDEVNRQMLSTIQALATAVDAKDHYTHDHSGRVARLCLATARRLGVKDAAACREVELAGLLHDIGKIGVPDAILSKTGRLTPDEFEIVKSHAQIGSDIVANVPGLESVARAVLHHHERYDGLGYPTGLSGEEIPFPSRLISTCDVFDCLTSDRPYRKGTDVDSAIRELERCKGTQLDPKVVKAFVQIIRDGEPLG